MIDEKIQNAWLNEHDITKTFNLIKELYPNKWEVLYEKWGSPTKDRIWNYLCSLEQNTLIENPTPSQKIAAIARPSTEEEKENREKRHLIGKLGLNKIYAKIAMTILNRLDVLKMKKEELSELTGFSIEKIDKIIRAKDLSLSYYEVAIIYNKLNLKNE